MKQLKNISLILTDQAILRLLITIAASFGIWFLSPLVAFNGVIFFANPIIRLVLIVGLFIIWAIANPVFGKFKKAPAPEKTTVELAKNPTEQLLTISFASVLDFCLTNKLDCHLVMGKANSGKSSLLQNSTLCYRPLDIANLPDINVAGICKWHLTKQAVFLEISEACANNGLLFCHIANLLKDFSRKNLLRSGIIVCSTLETVKQTEEQKLTYANILRQQLHVLQKNIGISLPTELVFAKTDLIAGFREYFADLSEDERHLAWGIKLNKKDKVTPQFTKGIDRLVNYLQKRLLIVWHKIQPSQKSSLLNSFPWQISQLKKELQGFVRDLSLKNNTLESINLRGIYFTSATQKDQPIDLLLKEVINAFDLEKSSSSSNIATSVITEEKTYFIDQLLHTIILSDSQALEPNRQIKKRQLIWQGFGYLICLAVLISAGTIWYQNYQQAKATITWLNKNLPTIQTMEQLKIAHNILTPKQITWQKRIGFYSISSVEKRINKFYLDGLNKYFVPEMLSTLEQQINTDLNNPEKLYPELRIYLMFSQPEHANAADIKNWFALHWQEQYSADKTKQSELNGELKYLLTEPLEQTSINSTLVTQARQALANVSLAELAFANLKNIANNQTQYDFSGLADNTQFMQVFAGSKIQLSPLFTPDGYHNIYQKYKDQVIKQVLDDSWVLATPKNTTPATNDLVKDLDSIYFRNYTSNWSDLSGSLRLTQCTSLQQLGNVLNILAGDNSPLFMVIEETNKNTTLSTSANRTEVDQAFSQMHITTLPSLKQSLSAAASYAQEINTATNTNEAAFKAAVDLMTNQQNPIMQLAQQGDQLPQPIKGWLGDLTNQYITLVLAGAHDYINDAWKNNVYTLYAQSIDGLYPFTKNSDTEANMVGVETFFAPNGVLDKFVQTYLQPFITVEGNSIVPRDIKGKTIGISSAALHSISQGMELRSNMFVSDNKLSMTFNLTPFRLDSNVAAFNMSFGSQQLSYRHGPQFTTPLTWSSEDESSDITIAFIDLNGEMTNKTYEGEWSLFKLIDDNKMVRRSADTYLLTMILDNRHVSYLLTAINAANQLDIEGLRSFSLPKDLN